MINLNVTKEEFYMILESLGNMPFKDVYNLIANLNRQANKENKENVDDLI